MSATARTRCASAASAGTSSGANSGVNGDFVVLYATPETATLVAGEPGYSMLAFRLADTSTAAANRTADDVREYLRAETSFTRFSDLPTIREPGSYPGKELFEQLASLMNVFTILALLAAGVLVANTMGTLIGEQRREIGMMKAIGGTRRQIRGVYLRTALLLGAIGAVLGVFLGVVIANLIVQFFGSTFFAISPGWSISTPVVIASLVLGILGPPLMALPAIRRGTRVPVREALEEVPALQGGVRVARPAPAQAHLPPAHGADRRPQRHPPHTPHDRDRRPDRARRGDARRRARADEQRHLHDRGRLERAAL